MKALASIIIALGAAAGCADGAPPPQRSAEDVARGAAEAREEREALEKARLEALEEAKAQARAARRRIARRHPKRFELAEHPPPPAPGELVRVYRRPITSGVIQVHEERAPTPASARARATGLLSEGWRPWPPVPAPELAAPLALSKDSFRECPFLMEVSDLPRDWLKGPRRYVECFRTVSEMERALEREYAIAYHHDRAQHCLELAGISEEDRSEPIESLRDRCAEMGVHVATTVRPTPLHRDLAERDTLNTTRTRVIRQGN